MRLLKPITAILLVPVLFLVGCGGTSTPEATFEGFKSAMQNEDFKTGFTYLTPESQDVLLRLMMLPLGMMKAFGQSPPELDTLLDKHGIDLESDDENALANVKDKGACFQDVLNLMKEQADNQDAKSPFSSDTFKEVTLSDLKIDGNSANGLAGGQPIYFTQVDGMWLIDLKKQLGDMKIDPSKMPGPGQFMPPPDSEGNTPGGTLSFPDTTDPQGAAPVFPETPDE